MSVTFSDPTGGKAALERISTLPDNWDSYGAPSVSSATIQTGLQLLYSTARMATPTPSVVPTGVGGLQLEWHARGMDIELYLSPGEEPELFVADRHEGTEDEAVLSTDLSALSQALARLTDRGPEAR